MKTQRRKLTAYQAQLEASVSRDTAAAKSLLAAGKRERALLVVRKRAATQALLGRVDGWLLRLEETLCSIDTAARTQALVATLRSGADVLKAITDGVQLSDVEALMDDTADARETVQRLQAALSGAGEDAEASAEAEEALRLLEAQMDEAAEAQLPTPPKGAPAVAVPPQPQPQPQARRVDAEALLAE